MNTEKTPPAPFPEIQLTCGCRRENCKIVAKESCLIHSANPRLSQEEREQKDGIAELLDRIPDSDKKIVLDYISFLETRNESLEAAEKENERLQAKSADNYGMFLQALDEAGKLKGENERLRATIADVQKINGFFDELAVNKLKEENARYRETLEDARYQMDFAPTKEEGARKAYQIIDSALRPSSSPSA